MTELQYQALVLVQALLGVISPNFRMIWITVESIITIHIVLEIECDDDMEEIEDLKNEFESLQNGSVAYDILTIISDSDFDDPEMTNTMIVYRRREIN